VAEAKAELGQLGERESLAGKMMLNYFGDPSLTLYDSSDDIIDEGPDADEGCGCAAVGSSGRGAASGWSGLVSVIFAAW
jgi:hypothetical protein